MPFIGKIYVILLFQIRDDGIGVFLKNRYVDMNLSERNLRDLIAERIGMATMGRVCGMVAENDAMLAELYRLTKDDNRRVATNALWVFTHLATAGDAWLASKRAELIDRVLQEGCDATRVRLMLTLLLRCEFRKDEVSAEFVDFCLEHTCASSQPYAIRALCMKLAYKQCCHYPELLAELKSILDVMAEEPLSAGLLSARRQVMKRIKSANRKNRISRICVNDTNID